MENLKNLKTALKLRRNINQFSTFAAASRLATNCIKLHLIMQGDHGKFWVVCFADAQKLEKAGYKLA